LSSVIKIAGPRPHVIRQAIAAEFPTLEWNMPDAPVAPDAFVGPFEEREPETPSPEHAARQILASAEERAREVLAAARAEAAAIEEAARAAGYADGWARAEAEAVERATETLARRAEQEERFQSECEAFFASAEPELAGLSVEIARKVLKQELELHPDAVLTVVRACMHRVKEKSARILVHPDDLARTRAARESFLGIADGMTDLEIVSDRRVGPGGCVVETPGGNLDARTETQLAYIGEVFDKGVEAHGDDA
jgi:flagellar biosynthesis/type III secretory pathway protein FliH